MQFDDNFIRRMNDEEYQKALSDYINELTERKSKEFQKQCNNNPFLKNRVEKIKKEVEKLSSDEIADFIVFAIGEKAKNFTNEIIEFNEKWDKEHYKVIYGKFGNK